jgi:hypothetical protein
LICNCPRESVDRGVRYLPLDAAARIECDALVMHSSGGGLDLTPLLAVTVKAAVRVVVLSGVDLPKGTEELQPDAIYVCSNFVRTQIWRYPYVAREKMFVTHYGVNRWTWTWCSSASERRPSVAQRSEHRTLSTVRRHGALRRRGALL